MRRFSRRLPQAGLKALWSMANDKADNWWKDLLGLWRPSGVPSGADGLRLAVRNGDLNFYYRGQSIAKVLFERQELPYARTHVKYVLSDAKESGYAKLTSRSITVPGVNTELPYEGISTLRQWIARSAAYESPEKRFVDELVGANASVIDLEMGLPAWGDRKSPLRLDMVSLHTASDGVQLVFWEAKRSTDKRLRPRGAKPEVCDQIAAYDHFLEDRTHTDFVRQAYRQTCRLFLEFKAMAEGCGRADVELDKAVSEAAREDESRIDVEPPLRLVITHDAQTDDKDDWPQCQKTLCDLGVRFIVKNGADPTDRLLPGVAM